MPFSDAADRRDDLPRGAIAALEPRDEWEWLSAIIDFTSNSHKPIMTKLEEIRWLLARAQGGL